MGLPGPGASRQADRVQRAARARPTFHQPADAGPRRGQYTRTGRITIARPWKARRRWSATHVWLCSHRTMLPSFWKTSCPANVTLRGYCSWTWMQSCSSSSTMSVPSASLLSAGIPSFRAKSTYFRSSCSVLRAVPRFPRPP